MKKQQYLKFMDYTVKMTDNKEYNTQAVAKMLGLPSNKKYNIQCRIIVNYLKKQAEKNDFIKHLLSQKKDNQSICKFLVQVLYNLFSPNEFPKKAPIRMSSKKYKELLKKNKNKLITKEEKEILDSALNIKYCHCVKKLYLKNLFIENILDEEPTYNPYAICMS